MKEIISNVKYLTEWLHSIDLKNYVNQQSFDEDWFKNNSGWLSSYIKDVGGIVLTNTGLANESDFECIARCFNWSPINYKGGNSPRTKLSKNIYTSTEWSSDLQIPLHSELSYTNSYPDYIMFACIIAADEGGETPLASNKQIWESLSDELKRDFIMKGVSYIRNLHGSVGLGPSWQDTFETDDRKEVEAYLEKEGVLYKWSDDKLHMEQIRPAFIEHPQKKCQLWFNQVDEFHPSISGNEIYQAMLHLVGGNASNLPVFVRFGDGTEIPEKYLEEIRRVAAQCSFVAPWKKGNIVLLDNLMVSHGRKAFVGDRKILVTMGI